MTTFLIDNPGIQTSVQDLGRRGLGRYGLPSCGAMDRLSLIIGNLILGNKPDCAALETVLHGLKIKALYNITLAITGADLSPRLNQRSVPLWTLLNMKPDDVLHFQRRKTGFRAYLCIQGGIDAPIYLGSRSTYPRGGMGRFLAKGDVVTAFPSISTVPRKTTQLPTDFGSYNDQNKPVCVFPGPQLNHFSHRGQDTFLNSSYTVTPRSDRQALCTEGPPIEHDKDPGIITDPTPQGAIQVPGDGQPIILLRDAQVTGGYAKIAVVTKVDLDRLGQTMPGDKLRFRFITQDEGLDLWDQRKQKLDVLAAILGRAPCSEHY